MKVEEVESLWQAELELFGSHRRRYENQQHRRYYNPALWWNRPRPTWLEKRCYGLRGVQLVAAHSFTSLVLLCSPEERSGKVCAQQG